MFVDIYDFKRYRTAYALHNVLVAHCRAVVKNDKIKAHCPWPMCHQKAYLTLKCSIGSKVAHCFACHHTFDALQIVAESYACSLRAACEAIKHLGQDC